MLTPVAARYFCRLMKPIVTKLIPLARPERPELIALKRPVLPMAAKVSVSEFLNLFQFAVKVLTSPPLPKVLLSSVASLGRKSSATSSPR